MSKTRVMIVDDDDKILYAFRQVINQEGWVCIEAMDGQTAIEKAVKEKPNVIFMDVNMPGIDGLAALEQIRAQNDRIPIIIITGEGSVNKAIRAMKSGAFDYLTKPVTLDSIRSLSRKALRSVLPTETTDMAPARLGDRYELLGNSVAMQDVYKLIGSVAATPNHTSVLITGESGTGKELVARTIHNNSGHPNEPFVAINCTALPETLLESELFGHEKGAFTGALQRKSGKFEVAGKGTIFLDEIGDLSLNLQQKLLRVLQEREFERVGGHDIIRVHARFVAASNRNLGERLRSGAFREDLFYRLNVVNIHLPPLRQRREDIPVLATRFLERYAGKLKKSVKGFSPAAMDLLLNHPFPGNVRQLENIVERAVMLARGAVVLAEDLLEPLIPAGLEQPAELFATANFSRARDEALHVFEKEFLIWQLARHSGNVTAAARTSGMSRQNFHRLMEKHGVKGKK